MYLCSRRCLDLGGTCSLLLSSGVDSNHPETKQNTPKKVGKEFIQRAALGL